MDYGQFNAMSQARVRGWSRTALSLPNLVILDSETTGQARATGGRDEIVELCVIDRNGSPLINTLVRPTGSIHPEASRINGITAAMVAEAPSFDTLADALANILRNRNVVIYNAEYDAPLLFREFQRAGRQFPPCEIRCAMLAYAAYRQIPGRRYGEYKWHKLADACAHEGIVPNQKAHRAFADCLMTLELLRRMAK